MISATVSAPGKVLLAGGYLILEREHSGTVVALDARFRTCVELAELTEAAVVVKPGLLVEVHSPQFRDVRRYMYDGASLEPVPVDGKIPSPNRYVEVPLLYCFTSLKETQGGDFFALAVARAKAAGCEVLPSDNSGSVLGLRITLAADNGFYSQAGELRARGWPLCASSLRRLPPMLPPRVDDGGDLPKTGLGSSATLVTSLLGALLHLFGAIELPSRLTAKGPGSSSSSSLSSAGTLQGQAALDVLHSLAQLCHCAAQGKVGSGFDVCSATFGSHVYKRFSPSVIADLLALPVGVPPPPGALRDCVGLGGGNVRVGGGAASASGGGGKTVAWDHEVKPFALPPGVEVIMADVSCGANTPSMVKKVLAWKKASADAAELWATYAKASRELQGSLQALCEYHRTGYYSHSLNDKAWLFALAKCGAADPETWASGDFGDMGRKLAAIRSGSIELRRLLRAISTAADTPIEPPEQTYLLDATLKVRGVLMAVVPGAGGNDAVIALILPSEWGGATNGADSTRSRVASMWQGWPQVAPSPAPSVVCELLVVESRSATASHNGILVEGPDAAEALATARLGGGVASESFLPGRYRQLRILTRSELQAAGGQGRQQRTYAVLGVGVAIVAALMYSSMRARSP